MNLTVNRVLALAMAGLVAVVAAPVASATSQMCDNGIQGCTLGYLPYCAEREIEAKSVKYPVFCAFKYVNGMSYALTGVNPGTDQACDGGAVGCATGYLPYCVQNELATLDPHYPVFCAEKFWNGVSPLVPLP